jgi:hypothetical protein
VAAASFSGVVHPTLIGPGGSLVFDLLHDYTGTPGAPVWGPYSTSEANWHGHDPWDLAANLRPLAGALWFRSGNGIPCPGDSVTSAPLEIGVYPMNLSLDARLASLGIAHQWFDRGCGTHEWRHWTDDIRTVLPSIMAVLAAPPPPPASFDYRFTDDTASVFGWTFSVTDRSAGAMTFVDDASASGLTVSGYGTLHVTPPTGGSFSTALTATPLRITLAAAAPTTASTAPPSPTTTTTTVPRPDPVAPLPPTGGDQDGLLVAAAVAVVTAGAARRLSGAGAGGHWPTRSG